MSLLKDLCCWSCSCCLEEIKRKIWYEWTACSDLCVCFSFDFEHRRTFQSFFFFSCIEKHYPCHLVWPLTLLQYHNSTTKQREQHSITFSVWEHIKQTVELWTKCTSEQSEFFLFFILLSFYFDFAQYNKLLLCNSAVRDDIEKMQNVVVCARKAGVNKVLDDIVLHCFHHDRHLKSSQNTSNWI